MIYPATDPKQVKWKYLISLHLLPIPNSHGIIIPNPLLSMIICIPQSQNLLDVFFVDLQGFWRLLVLLVFLHVFVDFILKINKKLGSHLPLEKYQNVGHFDLNLRRDGLLNPDFVYFSEIIISVELLVT